MRSFFLMRSVGSALLAVATISLCSCIVEAPPSAAMAEDGVVVREVPPPARVEVVPASPGPAYVWIDGTWARHGGAWVWAPGRWIPRPHAAAVWIPGHWVSRHGGWVWVGGYWR